MRGSQEVVVDALIPRAIERFQGRSPEHADVARVVKAIEEGATAIVFTNTRSQARSGIRRCSKPV